MSKIECRKGDVVYCVYADETALPDKSTIKSMKEAGYKLYRDGRLYKNDQDKLKE